MWAVEHGPANELTAEQQREVERLATEDRRVRAHEQSHVAAAGPYATGGPTFEYVTGPDGRQYAVAGEVQDQDTAPVEETPRRRCTRPRWSRLRPMLRRWPAGPTRPYRSRTSNIRLNFKVRLRPTGASRKSFSPRELL